MLYRRAVRIVERRSRLWIVSVAIVVAAVGCSPRSVRSKVPHANVLLITLDTTRADHLGCYDYPAAQTPNLDALARRALLFDYCITPTAYTLPSHSSIMTGLYPPAHGVRLNGEAALGDANVTLAERLSAKGYRTGAFVGAFVLDGRWGLSQGFQNYDDHFTLRPDQKLELAAVRRPANQVVDAALKWLEQDNKQPFFAWVHLYDAHAPYEPPEPFRSRFAAGAPKSLYDGAISFADSQVGRLLNWLDHRSLSENTVVIIVGDHGEGLGSHGEGEHGYYIYDYAVRVPLLIRIPGRASQGARIAPQVRTIDIAPTVMDLVAQEPLKGVQGASLLPLIAGQEKGQSRSAYSESMATNLQYGWSALYSIRTNDYKFIDAPRSELYEVRKDPIESVNRLDDLRRVAIGLRNDLKQIRDDAARRAPKPQEANLDQETLKKLASLGYLSGSSSVPRDDKNLADPKDKMHLFDSVGYAAHLLSKDDYKQAAEVLEIVLRDDPKIPQAQLLLATAYTKTNRADKAKTMLDAYLRQDPSNPRALMAMAEILANEGHGDDVLVICKRALAIDGRNAHAYELMADVYMNKGDPQSALPLLRKATEIQPKLTRSRNNLAACLISLGKLKEAETLLDKIIAEYPKFPLAHYHLGLLREREGRLNDARAAYQAEVNNQPKSFVARFNLGDVLLRLGDIAGAETQMRELIQQDPNSPRPYLMLARALLDRPGHLAEVETLARAGLQRAKEADLKALGYFLLADVYSREGRRAELEEAVRMGRHYRALIRG
jgi:arylsulfatase A-like enzyme/tetratricopeptide (TPR) repeat protein